MPEEGRRALREEGIERGRQEGIERDLWDSYAYGVFTRWVVREVRMAWSHVPKAVAIVERDKREAYRQISLPLLEVLCWYVVSLLYRVFRNGDASMGADLTCRLDDCVVMAARRIVPQRCQCA